MDIFTREFFNQMTAREQEFTGEIIETMCSYGISPKQLTTTAIYLQKAASQIELSDERPLAKVLEGLVAQ